VKPGGSQEGPRHPLLGTHSPIMPVTGPAEHRPAAQCAPAARRP
jgi:hypothetical protein